MKKLIFAVFLMSLAFLAIVKAGGTDWTDWAGDSDVNTLVYRTCDPPGNGGQTVHRIQFYNQGQTTVHIADVICNGGHTAGGRDLPAGSTCSFSFTDDNDDGQWTWSASE
jgi:hypothetical protein